MPRATDSGLLPGSGEAPAMFKHNNTSCPATHAANAREVAFSVQGDGENFPKETWLATINNTVSVD